MNKLLKNFLRKISFSAIEKEDRMQIALNSKSNSCNDFFGGWDESDIPLLKKYADSNPHLAAGLITDFVGVRTDPAFHAWLKSSQGALISSIPIPDDSIHAEAIEYISLFTAFERSKNIKSFVAVEIGASYAPWLGAAGVVAKRLGKTMVSLVAVEASEAKLESITRHQILNKLTLANGVDLKVLHGAAWPTKTTLLFPKVDVAIDNGGRVSEYATSVDYRGVPLEHVAVTTYTLEEIFDGFDFIDFAHIDIQGAEHNIISDDASLSVLCEKVSTLFLATHSRAIEGLAIARLSEHGWYLHRERPTMFKQNERTANVEGWTTRDGGQLWLNKKYNL